MCGKLSCKVVILLLRILLIKNAVLFLIQTATAEYIFAVLGAVGVKRVSIVIREVAANTVVAVAYCMALVHQFSPADVVRIDAVFCVDYAVAIAAVLRIDNVKAMRAVIAVKEKVPR